ncbi:hypothetical protein [Bifidobacterium psychraerophilum]|uniref:hypothetical protein n=1 Tax=Bifidobacterium psychraerophilum TaxID=218140 RepID=UPI003340FF13
MKEHSSVVGIVRGSILRHRIVFPMLAILLVVATAARLAMSLTLHMWYSWRQSFDDELLMSQSFREHYAGDDYLTLTKNPGYGYWIILFSKIGLNADIAQFLLWVAAAVVIGAAMWRLFRSMLLSAGAYLYVLWNPIAFEHWLGTRLYRNSLFPPLLFLLLGLLILLLNAFTPIVDRPKTERAFAAPHHARAGERRESVSGTVGYIGFAILGAITGAVMCLAYLLKEDSVWLLPMFAFVLLAKVVLTLCRHTDPGRKAIMVVLTLVPAMVFAGGVATSSAINHHYFGVGYLNTRTEGALGGFVNRIYAIDNPEQTPAIWAPASSLERAIQVSPTLQAQENLLDKLKHSGFVAPDIKKNPIQGDFLTWQLRLAIDQSGNWDDEEHVQQLFTNVNSEIDAAFKDGRLKKTEKTFLTAGMVPRTNEEIRRLGLPTLRVLFWTIDPTSQYRVTEGANDVASDPENTKGLMKLGIDPNNPNPQFFSFLTVDRARQISKTLVKVYRTVNYVLIASLLAALVMVIAGLLRRRRTHALPVTLAVLLILYAGVYGFSVVWFTEYLNKNYVTFFYAVGSTTPFVCTALLLAAGSLVSGIRRYASSLHGSGAVQSTSRGDSPLRTLG